MPPRRRNQVQSRLLLDIVVRKSAAVLKLLASKNQALLIRGNAFLVLNFGFDIIDRVRGLHVKGDGLASQSFHENLHATTKTQHQVQSRLLLDVVVRESAAVLKLLASKNQALLIRRNAFLILNFGFDIIDRVRGLHVKGDGLASQSFHENLHATTKTQHQVQSLLLLDVVVRESAAVLKLLASKNQTLLIRRNA